MGRQKKISGAHGHEEPDLPRPKRKATNAHIFRYLQTRNPSRLEETDLKKALEASLEECPDFWPEDTASCSSSDQSNGTSASSTTSIERGCNTKTTSQRGPNQCAPICSRRKSKSSMQQNHLNHNCNCHNHHQCHHPTNMHANSNCTANHPYQCCPMSSSCSYRSNRYKPVAKKNVYNEADFFHDGIMEFIEFELFEIMIAKQKASNSNDE